MLQMSSEKNQPRAVDSASVATSAKEATDKKDGKPLSDVRFPLSRFTVNVSRFTKGGGILI